MIVQRTCPDRDVEINIGDYIIPKKEYRLDDSRVPCEVIDIRKEYGSYCVIFMMDGVERAFHPDNVEERILKPHDINPPKPFVSLCRRQIELEN